MSQTISTTIRKKASGTMTMTGQSGKKPEPSCMVRPVSKAAQAKRADVPEQEDEDRKLD